MLADFRNFFTVVFSKKFATKPMPHCPHTLDVSLHYLAKCKRTKLAKFCCILLNNTCLMFIKLTNKRCKQHMHYWSWIKCSKGPKVLLSHKFTRRDISATHQQRHRWCFAWNDARHQSSAASVHRHHELARRAAAFLSFFCSQSGSYLFCCVAKVLVKWTQVSRFSRLTLLRARWAGILPCWKIKNSPQISRMTNSSFWVRSTSQ